MPAGIDDGQRLRLAGRGPAAPRGGEAGDLFVAVHVVPNAHVRTARRRPLAPAAGLDRAGRARRDSSRSRRSTASRELEVQSGTQPGARLRLHGLGVPSLRNGRRGDLVVEVDVRSRRNLNARAGRAARAARGAARRGGHRAARGAVLAHPVGLPVVTRPAGDAAGPSSVGRAPADAAAHAFVDALDDPSRSPAPTGTTCSGSAGSAPGEHVTLADGAGTWRRYEIESVAPGRLRLGARSDRFVEPEIVPRVALAVALDQGRRARDRRRAVHRARRRPHHADPDPALCRAVDARRRPSTRSSACGVTAREAAAQSRRARVPADRRRRRSRVRRAIGPASSSPTRAAIR